MLEIIWFLTRVFLTIFTSPDSTPVRLSKLQTKIVNIIKAVSAGFFFLEMSGYWLLAITSQYLRSHKCQIRNSNQFVVDIFLEIAFLSMAFILWIWLCLIWLLLFSGLRRLFIIFRLNFSFNAMQCHIVLLYHVF